VQYKIVRLYRRDLNKREVVKTGLTKEEALDYCTSNDVSSRTCTTRRGGDRTTKFGPWFESYFPE
jgi:hypothetical protein